MRDPEPLPTRSPHSQPRGGSVPQLFTVRDTASILAVSERQVRHWIEVGRLTCVRLGRSVRIEQREIEQLIEEGRES